MKEAGNNKKIIDIKASEANGKESKIKDQVAETVGYPRKKNGSQNVNNPEKKMQIGKLLQFHIQMYS